ncbi:hypothetical protein [Roseibium alexandrii]|uniref:hypothetical protein n=1 Tax=Roseibium alexandrii TaxID=388408 RepID=UPI0037501E4C
MAVATQLRPRAKICYISHPGALTDALMTRGLQSLAKHLESTLPLELAPQICFLTARNAAQRSIPHAAGIDYDTRATITCVMPDGNIPRFSQVTMATDNSKRTVRVTSEKDDLLRLFDASQSVLAIGTHGFEACANGGGGIILCGRRSDAPTRRESPEPGILACGRGYSCPRGPHPIELSRVSARVGFLGSCNSGRLADSVMHSDFNLMLNMLDGACVSVAGSLFSSVGGSLAAQVFCACMADGETFASAVLHANALLYQSGLEHPCYIAVGQPSTKSAINSASSRTRTILVSSQETLDAGEANTLEIVLDGAKVPSGRVGALIKPHTDGTPVLFFSRWEADIETLEAPGRPVLRLYRFPESLGRFDIEIFDYSQRIDQLAGLADSLATWIEVGQQLNSSIWSQCSEVTATLDELDSWLSNATKSAAYSGQDSSVLPQIENIALTCVDTARQVVGEEMARAIAGTFWPTNLFGTAMQPQAFETGTCANCNAPTFDKKLAAPRSGMVRRTSTCPRCGIVSDLNADDMIKSIRISAPEVVSRGQEWDAKVALELTEPQSAQLPVSVFLRLSALGVENLDPAPLFALIDLSQEAGLTATPTAGFHFNLPGDLPPHRYFLKALATTEKGLGFASRVIFVK